MLRRKLTVRLAIRQCLFVVVLLFVAACRKTETVETSGGSFTYNGSSYGIKAARADFYGDSYNKGYNVIDLYFYPSTITFTESTLRGNGAIIALEFHLSGDTIPFGQYAVLPDSLATDVVLADSSFLITYPQSAGDTVTDPIIGGTIRVESHKLGKNFAFNLTTQSGQTIDGSFHGAQHVTRRIEAPSVGMLQIDTLSYNLQEGKIINWGYFFSESAFYYELYLPATTLYYTDAGKILSGMMFVVGLHSTSSDAPADGTYPISPFYDPATALVGSKYGNVNWGTFWTTYLNGTVLSRVNVTRDSLTLTRAGDTYTITFNLTDQLSERITGSYSARLRQENS